MSTEKSHFVTGNAARVAAHRSQHVRIDVSVLPRTADAVDELASQFSTSRAVVVRSLLRFALTNRNWKVQGLLWVDEVSK